MSLYGMDCIVCGGDLFMREENIYQDGERDTCQECGVVHWITVEEDGGLAYASTDERVEDRGQPRCNGSHCGGGGAVKELHGTPCRWDCKRAIEAAKEGCDRALIAAAPELLERLERRVVSCLCGLPKPTSLESLMELAGSGELCGVCDSDLAAIAAWEKVAPKDGGSK